jgi:two-component system nitrogen regulation response regulator GlnG/two-component system response regulator HydG
MADTTLTGHEGRDEALTGVAPSALALAIVWAGEEPERVGEVLLVGTGRRAVTVGRGVGETHLVPVRQRPGENEVAGPLASPAISREQLRITPVGTTHLDVENVGRCEMRVGGRPVRQARLSPGDVLELGNQMSFLCTERPLRLPSAAGVLPHLFGLADYHGLVGESPATWELRRQIAFAVRADTHVLVLGHSGTGKELVARAIHATSRRRGRSFVARNAATLPGSLVDAELFGNVAGYPNPGMRERPGLFGEAEGSTLFLDEIGELSEEAQAHLLRVLDGGEYHRLGESKGRRVDVRVVAATNRPEAALKHDLLARFPVRIRVPGLSEREEDIPLLVGHLLREVATRDPGVARQFFPEGDVARWPRITPELIRRLLGRTWEAHTREIATWLWLALAQSRSERVEAPEGLTAPQPPAREVGKEELQAAVERRQGVLEQVWRDLGLANRFQLSRLLKKHGLR